MYFPGVPVFHSRNLVDWVQIGHVLDRPEQLMLKGIRANGGIYAPTLRYSNGTYYMITTSVDGIGNFYVTATDPAGPWSDPIIVAEPGIDPSLFFDDDGKVYYTQHVGLGDGYIGQAEIDIRTGKLKGPLQNIWSGIGYEWPEGPHLYKIDGTYYLLIAEGGTSVNHMITVARSSSPMGPFESFSGNPIFTHKDEPDNPYYAIGHGDIVDSPDGWWLVCLGVRNSSPQLGREMFLTPIDWKDGWPVSVTDGYVREELPAPDFGESVLTTKSVREDFDRDTLPAEWSYVRNPNYQNYSLTERPGFLRLKGSEVSLGEEDSPTFLGIRQKHAEARIAARFDFIPESENEEAGLCIRSTDSYRIDFALRLAKGKRHAVLQKVWNDEKEIIGSMEVPQTGEVTLEIAASKGEYAFSCTSDAGDSNLIGRVDASSYTYEKTRSFMGVVIGVYASGNGKPNTHPADIDWFEYEGIEK